jgi:SAM-dependent methyltransferase
MAQCISLFCALADPPRFGTDTDRYPDQMETLQCHFRKWPRNRPLRLLDIGCGVGLNTLEILSLAKEEGVQVHAMGLTAEPLEAWMAQNRQLPHDSQRQRRLQAFPAFPVTFCSGDARDFQFPEPVDLMICNGLAGGRFLHGEEELRRFLACCRRQLAPHGRLLMANHFHDGFRPALANLMQWAAATGWTILHDNLHHTVLSG